ncbi:MAG: hypothetical protein K2N75_07715 [Helicobacter sp.]|uniref:hypothetical protein n=1 Tax=Helicobacter sp. TaxID=218 RepID=UPI0023BF99DD|nr:hypothetical protein [Helicobacter sp.]MDE7175908.1 hypothetical protein [Helicobacter sp.]
MQSTQLIGQEILTKLKAASYKAALDEVILLIRSLGKQGQEELEFAVRLEIIALLRQKALDLIYHKGDIPDYSFLWCFGIFGDFGADYEIPQDTRFNGFIDLVSYVKNTESDYERLVFINCISVAMLLRGDREEAIKFFLRHIIYLDLVEQYMEGLNTFVLDFCFYYQIPIEWILKIQKEALEEEYFWQISDRKKKSIFLWSMHIFWNVKHYFNDLKWRENFPVWLGVLKQLLEQGNLDLAMYVEFYIYHKFGNSAQTQEDWQEYNDKVVKLVEPYFVEYGKTLPRCKELVARNAGRKVKIGILKDRIVANSPYKVEYSLIKALLGEEEFASQYEIVVYSMAYIQKSIDDIPIMQSLVEIGASVVSPTFGLVQQHSYYVPHLQKAMTLRNRILADEIDILISTGTIDGSDFLFATRSAPKQIFWSHGNGRYDISGIDERISHAPPKDAPYVFKSFSVPMDRDRFYNPPRAPEVIAAEKAKYPIGEDTIVLGVIGRLVKVDSDAYLEAIAEIMQKHKNTIFIAAGAGNIPVIREKVEKLGISERFFMPGFVDPHIYGHIIDIFCNTFPLEQGESIAEYASKRRGAYISLIPSMEFRRNSGIKMFNEFKNIFQSMCKKYNVDFEYYKNEALYGGNDKMQPDTIEGYKEALDFFIAHKNDKKVLQNICNIVDVYGGFCKQQAILEFKKTFMEL